MVIKFIGHKTTGMKEYIYISDEYIYISDMFQLGTINFNSNFRLMLSTDLTNIFGFKKYRIYKNSCNDSLSQNNKDWNKIVINTMWLWDLTRKYIHISTHTHTHTHTHIHCVCVCVCVLCFYIHFKFLYIQPDNVPQRPQNAAYMAIHGCVRWFLNVDFLNF